jgi:hypothetical protein
MQRCPVGPFLALTALFTSALTASAQVDPLSDARGSSVAAIVDSMDLSLRSHDDWAVNRTAPADPLDLSLRMHDGWALG